MLDLNLTWREQEQRDGVFVKNENFLNQGIDNLRLIILELELTGQVMSNAKFVNIGIRKIYGLAMLEVQPENFFYNQQAERPGIIISEQPLNLKVIPETIETENMALNRDTTQEDILAKKKWKAPMIQEPKQMKEMSNTGQKYLIEGNKRN